MIEFGMLLRKLRKENGESLQSLATKLGVGVPFLSLIENGKKLVPVEYGDKLIKIFNLDPDSAIELRDSIDYSNKKISIDLEKMNELQKEVSITFARTINTASQKKLEELRKLLENVDEE